MSLIVEIFALCDGCDETFPDFRADTKKQVRVYMRDNGWKRINGRDYCHECVKLTKQSRPIGRLSGAMTV